MTSPQARPGNRNSERHGAYSPTRIKAKARAHRRRFLRNAGLAAGDLDAVAREYLSQWAETRAVLDLRHEADATVARDYWVAVNAVRRNLAQLERRMKERGLDRQVRTPEAELADYLERRATT